MHRKPLDVVKSLVSFMQDKDLYHMIRGRKTVNEVQIKWTAQANALLHDDVTQSTDGYVIYSEEVVRLIELELERRNASRSSAMTSIRDS